MEEKNSQHNSTKERSDHRLKKNKQFNYIFRKGERFSTKNFNLYVAKSRFEDYKIGFSIYKKEGKATKRNLLRRRLKEIVRIHQLPQKHFNYVLQARIGACELDFDQIENQIIQLFSKASMPKQSDKVEIDNSQSLSLKEGQSKSLQSGARNK